MQEDEKLSPSALVDRRSRAIELAKLLVKHGADTAKCSNVWDHTRFGCPALQGLAHPVRLHFISSVLEFSATDSQQSHSKKRFNFLWEGRGDVPINKIRDFRDLNVLSAAAMAGDVELVRTMIEKHVSVLTLFSSDSPLLTNPHICCYFDKGVNPWDARALHHAAIGNSVAVLEYLLSLPVRNFL